MAVKRVAIVLPGLGVYGGVNIALNWAVILAKAGYHLDLILPQSASRPNIHFLPEEDSRLLNLVADREARRHHYYAVISTIWYSIAEMAELSADHYAWFMQAYESQFMELNSPAQADFDEILASQMNIITTANWLQQHILQHYSFEPKRTFCVISGLNKTLWKTVPREPLRSGGRPSVFLVEGPINDARKNAARTVRLLEKLGISYTWVGSKVDRTVTGPHCRGVYEQVPYHRMPEIYGATDVLVKASNSEGMFGPPLEMFATGGTAAVWNVQGAEEYMSDRYNSRLVPMNSWSRLAEVILELADDPEQVCSLQENAVATAEAWPTWEGQAEQILTTIESLVPFGRSSLVRHVAANQFRSIIHSQPVLLESQRAGAEAARADRAEARLAVLEPLVNSRAWRLVRLLQRARHWLAPDRSRRWAYSLRVGRVVLRIGRRVRSIGLGVNRLALHGR